MKTIEYEDFSKSMLPEEHGSGQELVLQEEIHG